MSSASVETLTKMLESLPDSEQVRVVEHLREYIEMLSDELNWSERSRRLNHDWWKPHNVQKRKSQAVRRSQWTTTGYELRYTSIVLGRLQISR